MRAFALQGFAHSELKKNPLVAENTTEELREEHR
jgi:hypothetical protein